MTKRNIGQEILDSIKEIKAGRIGRITVIMAPDDIKSIRENIGATQKSFAALMNIPVATVRDWEQGRRQPEGPAQSLLVIAAQRPDILQELFVG